MFFTPLALLLVPFVAQFVYAQNQCTRTYTVQEGDICDSISAANNASTYQLAVVNSNVIDPACDNLVPGESICLGWEGEDCTDTYVVNLGDDCDDVAYAFNLNSTIFNANNPQLNEDCTNMYIGEVLCVAQVVLAPPLPSGTIPASVPPPTSTPSIPWCD